MRVGSFVLRYVHERRQLGQFTQASARDIRYTLWQFAVYIGVDAPPSRITGRRIENWLLAMRVGPATMRARFSRVRSFVHWMLAHGYMRADPTVLLAAPRQPRYLPRGVPDTDIDRLVDVTPDRRTRLMVVLMAREGLRCCEVARLQVGDLDAAHKTMIVRGKGGHERRLPISGQSWDELVAYLRTVKAKSAGPVVRSLVDPHRGIDPQTVSHLVGQAMRAAQVKGSAHSLRHAMAQGMVDRGADIRSVRDALGHRSLKTTDIYVGSTPPEQLRSDMTVRRYGRR